MGVWVIMEFKVGKCLGKVIEISFKKRTQRRKNGDLSFEEFFLVRQSVEVSDALKQSHLLTCPS